MNVLFRMEGTDDLHAMASVGLSTEQHIERCMMQPQSYRGDHTPTNTESFTPSRMVLKPKAEWNMPYISGIVHPFPSAEYIFHFSSSQPDLQKFRCLFRSNPNSKTVGVSCHSLYYSFEK